MNKTELISLVAENTGLSKTQVASVTNAILKAIRDSLIEGENVSLQGLGTFYVRQMEEREGRNPRTGDIIRIPGKKAVRFRHNKTLKDLLNGLRTSNQPLELDEPSGPGDGEP